MIRLIYGRFVVLQKLSASYESKEEEQSKSNIITPEKVNNTKATKKVKLKSKKNKLISKKQRIEKQIQKQKRPITI